MRELLRKAIPYDLSFINDELWDPLITVSLS